MSSDIDLNVIDDGVINLAIGDSGDVNVTFDSAFSTFRLLTDTPAAYSGQSGKIVAVKSTEDGLEFTTAGSGSGDVTAAVNLTDETLIQGDGGAKGIKTSTVTVANVTTNNAKISYNSTASTKLGTIEENADVTDVTNVTAAGAAMSGGAFHDGFSDFVANEHIDWTSDQGSTNINAGNYTNTTYTAGDFAHDSLASIPVNDHLDWTADQGAKNIHANNYTDTDTTAHASFSQLDYASAGHTGFAPALGGDDNYVTDDDITLLGNTSGANSGDNAVNSNYSSLVTNQTHTGEVTGSIGLIIANSVVDIANIKTDAAPSNDYVLVADSGEASGWKWAASSSGFSDPMTTVGDIIIKNSSNTTTRLGIGTNGQTILSDGTNLSWGTPAGGGNVSTSGTPVDNDFAKFVDGTDIEGRSYSEVRTDLNIEDGADVTDATNVAAAGAAMSGGAFHDGFSDFVANEHIDWTTDQGATDINAGNYTNTTYAAGDFSHNSLADLNAGTDYEHITQTQKDALHAAVTLNASATTGGLSLSGQEIANRAATSVQTGYATAAHIIAIEANTEKDTNVDTNLSEGTSTTTTVDVNSSDGTNATLVSASTSRAGLLTKAKFDEIVVNSLKDTDVNHNVTTNLSMGTVDGTKYTINSSDGNNVELPLADTNNWGIISDEIFDNIATNTGKDTNVSTNITIVEAPTNVSVQSSDGTNDTIAAADETNAGVMTTTMYDEHVLNNDKLTNANHSGDATGSGALTLATVNSDVGSYTNADITVNAKGLITAAANGSGGGGLTWSDVTGTTQAATVNYGYVANNASLVTVTLPSTASVGDILRVVGLGDGGWRIAQNASEYIYFGNATTTTGTGGYLEFTHSKDSVELVCVVANTGWSVMSSVGNITVA